MTDTSTKRQALLDQIKDQILAKSVAPELAASAIQLVFGSGNPESQLVFIGEAPGAKEDKLGKPFVGASGKLLDEMLRSISMDRQDIYITNIVKYRPPANRDPRPSEIVEFIPYLKSQLEIIQPKLVIFLGRHSMNVFLPDLKISEAHGRVVDRDGAKYLPLFHPAAALYNPKMRATLFDDFGRIPSILEELS
jgi:uracil-DNA glycosylase family 4